MLTQLATLDLGNSMVSGHPVWEEISSQLGASALLAVSAVMVSLLFAIPIGFLNGMNPGFRFERLNMNQNFGQL